MPDEEILSQLGMENDVTNMQFLIGFISGVLLTIIVICWLLSNLK